MSPTRRGPLSTHLISHRRPLLRANRAGHRFELADPRQEVVSGPAGSMAVVVGAAPNIMIHSQSAIITMWRRISRSDKGRSCWRGSCTHVGVAVALPPPNLRQFPGMAVQCHPNEGRPCWGGSCTAAPELDGSPRWQYNCHPNECHPQRRKEKRQSPMLNAPQAAGQAISRASAGCSAGERQRSKLIRPRAR